MNTTGSLILSSPAALASLGLNVVYTQNGTFLKGIRMFIGQSPSHGCQTYDLLRHRYPLDLGDTPGQTGNGLGSHPYLKVVHFGDGRTRRGSAVRAQDCWLGDLGIADMWGIHRSGWGVVLRDDVTPPAAVTVALAKG
jgi:hypothetical protein